MSTTPHAEDSDRASSVHNSGSDHQTGLVPNMLSLAQGEENSELDVKAPSAASEATINVLIVSPSITAAAAAAASPNPSITTPFLSSENVEQKSEPVTPPAGAVTDDGNSDVHLQARPDSHPTADAPPTVEEGFRQTLQRSVRFRSRVRITSGVHTHHHHHAHGGLAKPRRPSSTSVDTAGSRSSSPCSSISAPLRDPPDADSGVWRLGMPLHLSPAKSKRNRRQQQQSHHSQHYDPRTPLRHSSATTPLLAKPSYYSTADLDSEEGEHSGEDSETEESRLNREIDIVFGKWPARLLNRHWWWWQLEPIVCCNACCLDDEDTEPD